MRQPLANVLRPASLDRIIGQEHLTGDGCILKLMAIKKSLQSTILWGPPGIGKTSIVTALANDAQASMVKLNATEATVKDIRKVIETARGSDKQTIVFIDEIHRWTKSQQDVVLPVVEDGTIVLFGATTERPKFAVNSTILSRCLVLEVKPLDTVGSTKLLLRIKEYYKSVGVDISISKPAAKLLITRSSGDARKLITVIETCASILSDDGRIEEEHIEVAMPDKHLVFDSSGNEHYDYAHCYQESIQNSDTNSAIYWLAQWLSAGEDPAYICRRMLITAFEDCAGNPNAWLAAMAATYVTERTGMPECMIPMALATVEMGRSNRDKTAYYAIKQAMDDVINKATVHVPPELRAGARGYVSITGKDYVGNR